MEEKQRVIDIRQYVLFLWENFLLICIVAGACALALFFREYKKEKSSSGTQMGNVQTIISQNHDAYYGVGGAKYTDASAPSYTYNSTAKVYLDLNFDNFDEEQLAIDASTAIAKIAKDAEFVVVSQESINEIIDELNLKEFGDLKDRTADDIQWLINKNLQGAHVMNIVVTDVNAQRAHDICEAVTDKFVEKVVELGTAKEAKVLDKASLPVENPNNYRHVDKKAVFKKGIIGGAAGFVLIAFILFMVFLSKDFVRTDKDAAFFDQKIFGNVSKRRSRRDESIKRLAINVDNIKDASTVVIIPIDAKTKVEAVVEAAGKEIKELKSQKKLSCTKALKSSTEGNVAMRENDAIILAAEFGKTKMKDLVFALNEAERADKKVEGILLVDTIYD